MKTSFLFFKNFPKMHINIHENKGPVCGALISRNKDFYNKIWGLKFDQRLEIENTHYFMSKKHKSQINKFKRS